MMRINEIFAQLEIYRSPYVADRAISQNPDLWAETIGDVKEVEQEAKKLVLLAKLTFKYGF